MIYLETDSTNPHYNLAFEEYVLTNRTEGDYLILWQNADSVIIGRNQNAYEEVDFKYLSENDIDLVRRQTGGGAVFHDLGNLNYSFITDWDGGENRSFKDFTRPVVSALNKLGLSAEASGRNDILVSGKKISGTAMRIEKDRVLHHGTLLFDSNPEKISSALKTDPLKFQSKAVKSVRSRVGNIRDFLVVDMSINQFWDYLLMELSGNGFYKDCLNTDEFNKVKAIQAERYDNRDWNYGRSPQFSFSDKRRFDGGILEVHFTAALGTIEEISLYGDYMALRNTEDVVFALTGAELSREGILSGLKKLKYPLEDYFGGILAEEIADIILGA